MTQERQNQYKVSSKWCGWFGGWGSEQDIATHIENEAAGGWRLVRAEAMRHGWFLFFPRPKIVFIFER